MRVIDACTLESRDDAIEFGNAWNRTDAHPIHSAARDVIVAYEYFAIAAAAQFLHEPLGVVRIAEGPCLNKERTGHRNSRDSAVYVRGCLRRLRDGRRGWRGRIGSVDGGWGGGRG